MAAFAPLGKRVRAEPVRGLHPSRKDHIVSGVEDLKLARKVGVSIITTNHLPFGSERAFIRRDVLLIASRAGKIDAHRNIHRTAPRLPCVTGVRVAITDFAVTLYLALNLPETTLPFIRQTWN